MDITIEGFHRWMFRKSVENSKRNRQISSFRWFIVSRSIFTCRLFLSVVQRLCIVEIISWSNDERMAGFRLIVVLFRFVFGKFFNNVKRFTVKISWQSSSGSFETKISKFQNISFDELSSSITFVQSIEISTSTNESQWWKKTKLKRRLKKHLVSLFFSSKIKKNESFRLFFRCV